MNGLVGIQKKSFFFNLSNISPHLISKPFYYEPEVSKDIPERGGIFGLDLYFIWMNG